MAVEIPGLGLGTWKITDREVCVDVVSSALDMGYRHVDTAQYYRNEEAVGEGVRQADVDREEVFVATKIWIDNLVPDDVVETAQDSLDRLGMDYVDMLYVHWPAGAYSPRETLAAFEELREEGLTRYIGVSNFTGELLLEALEYADVAVNQVEIHPLLHQDELVETCRNNGVEVVAYSPLARGNVGGVPELMEISRKHNVSEARVALAWLVERASHPIPKASTEDHLRDNIAALDLELDSEDVRKIEGIDRRKRFISPEFAPDWTPR